MRLTSMTAVVLAGCASMVGIHDAPAPGDSSAYTPFASIPAVQTFCGPGSEFLDANAFHVKSDGTQDFGAKYEPYTVYQFLRPAAGDPDMPVGAGGGAGLEKVIVRVSNPGFIHITKMGGTGPNIEQNVRHRGMVEFSTTSAKAKDKEDVRPLPTCTAADLWKGAIANGAPADAVARITYGHFGYTFDIEDLDFKLYFDAACTPSKTARLPGKAGEEIEKAKAELEKLKKSVEAEAE